MKAAVVEGAGQLVLRDVPMPTVGPYDALVRIAGHDIGATSADWIRWIEQERAGAERAPSASCEPAPAADRELSDGDLLEQALALRAFSVVGESADAELLARTVARMIYKCLDHDLTGRMGEQGGCWPGSA